MKTLEFIKLNESGANNVVASLQQLLADFQVYYTNLRGFHWNIKGHNFFVLHSQFEKMYDDTAEKVDEIEYVDGDVDIDFWDPLFTECVALDLAAKLAGPVCQSPNLESAMIQKLNQVEFPDAITQDAREVLSAENNPTMKNLSKSLLLRARL